MPSRPDPPAPARFDLHHSATQVDGLGHLSMRKRRRGALREAPGSDSVRVPRAAHSSPVKLSIAYGSNTGRVGERCSGGTAYLLGLVYRSGWSGNIFVVWKILGKSSRAKRVIFQKSMVIVGH